MENAIVVTTKKGKNTGNLRALYKKPLFWAVHVESVLKQMVVLLKYYDASLFWFLNVGGIALKQIFSSFKSFFRENVSAKNHVLYTLEV